MSTALFEQASREKFRFLSTKGKITAEDLWDLSLEALDQIAIALNRQIKASQEESFLSTTTANDSLVAHLEIVKYIIKYKQDLANEKKQEAIRKAEKQKLLGLLEQKQDAALASLSVEELQKRLQELA